jgi:hypothetical protein
MTITTPAVDIEAALSQWLRDDPAIAQLVGDRVYTSTPRQPTFPLVRLYRYGGLPPHDRPLTHDNALMQLDAFGGSKAEASSLIQQCRVRIGDAYGQVLYGITVGRIGWGSLAFDPDPSYEPAKPRYRCDFTATHRLPLSP